MCTSAFTPTFAPQNPALSGDRYGWYNCAAYVGAYGASYGSCGAQHPTGAQVRALTNEPIPDPASPGLTTIQVRDALAKIGVPVTPFNRMAWSGVEALIDGGAFVMLAVQYSVIRPTAYSGDPSFYGGHAIGVPPGWGVMDPLCDGRRAGIYKYHGAAYPRTLLRSAAGAFRVVQNGTPTPIGAGWAQGWYTVAHPSPIVPPPPQPPQESAVRVTNITRQQWTANGTNGVLRNTPARTAQVTYRLPAGTVITSMAEATDPSGNYWRQVNHPTGTNGVAWLLRFGPGVPRDHDWIAGAILPNP